MSYPRSLAVLLASSSLAYACTPQIIVGLGSTSSSTSTSAATSAVSAGGAASTGTVGAVGGGGAIGFGGASGAGGSPCSAPGIDSAPIGLPGRAANLDLAGPTHMGLTLAQAEEIDCTCVGASVASGGAGGAAGTGGADGGATGSCSYGGSGEVWIEYALDTQIVLEMTLWPGYVGTLDATSRDGADKFSFTINNQQSTKNGYGYAITWPLDGSAKAAFNAEINEIHDALMATYAPGVPTDLDCLTTEHCIYGSFGDVAFMSFPELGLTLWVASQSQPQPTPSIFNRADLQAP